MNECANENENIKPKTGESSTVFTCSLRGFELQNILQIWDSVSQPLPNPLALVAVESAGPFSWLPGTLDFKGKKKKRSSLFLSALLTPDSGAAGRSR